MAAPNEVIFLERGLKIVKSLKFNAQMQVQSVIHTGDSLTVCHNSCTNDNYLIQYPIVKIPQEKRPPRYNIPVPINKLLYINDVMMYVAFCVDFRLRVYNQDYDLLTTLALSFNVTCTCYDEDNHVLYAGGIGHLSSWNLQLEGYNVLLPSPPIKFSLLDREQIVSLSLCRHDPLLCVTCIHGIYLLNTQTCEEEHFISNARNSPLICATVYSPLKYVIAARSDGTIKVMSYTKTVKDKVLHRQWKSSITSLFVHPDSPFLISSSLSGTIRFWNLMTLTETLIHDVKLPIPSVTLTASRQLLCSSFSNIFLFDINQVVELLSVTHSEVTLLRVNEHRNIQRIVALTGNGCIRVILPHSGKFRTVLLPILSTRMLQGVLYNMIDDVLYLLLRTGEILIYNTKTKPCTPLEMWAPSNQHQEVSCMDMVQSHVGPVIFAGLRSGFLCILHAKDCLIALPCPAHDEAIIAIASSQSSHHFRKNPAINVVTYANSGLYHVWAVEIKTDTCNRLIIHDVVILNLNIHPIYMKLIDTKLCITTSINQVLMYNVPMEENNATVVLASPKPLHQSTFNNHSDKITALACSHTLQLFATCSCDGRIKIWDNQCCLVSDIFLKSTVTCVNFNELTHDLLVGFQNQLFVISPLRYLPKSIHDLHHSSDSMVEYPLPFQPKLKFWFDCNTVPILPLLPHARNNTVDFVPTPNPYTLRLISQPQPYNPGSLELQIQAAAGSSNLRQLGSVDPDSRRIAQQLSLSELINSSAAFVRSYSSTKLIPTNKSDTVVNQSNRRRSSRLKHLTQFRRRPSYKRRRAASIAPVKKPSINYPVAPDGYIPNSVVRAKVAENKPLDHVLQRVLIKQYRALECQRNTTAKRKQLRKVLLDLKYFTEQELDTPTYEPPQTPLIEEESEEESEEEEQETRKTRVKFDFTIPQWMPHESYSNQDKKPFTRPPSLSKYRQVGTPPEPLPTLPTYSCKIEVGEEEEEIHITNTSNRFNTASPTKLTTNRSPFSDFHDNRPLTYGAKKVVGLKLGYKPKTPPLFPDSGNVLQRTQSAIIYRERDTELREQIKNSRSTPLVADFLNKINKKTGIKEYQFDNNTFETQGEQDEELVSALTNILEKPWFPLTSIPQDTEDSDDIIDWIIDMLVNKLDGAEISIFQEITEAFVTLHAKNVITDHQKKVTGQKLLGKYFTSSPKHQDQVLDLMLKIGYKPDEETLMTILPTLIHEDDNIKHAGFKALRRLTGVTDRIGLHKLLLNTKLIQHVEMNEDEDINDLKERFESPQPPTLPNVYHKRLSEHLDRENDYTINKIGFRVIAYGPRPTQTNKHFRVISRNVPQINTSKRESLTSPIEEVTSPQITPPTDNLTPLPPPTSYVKYKPPPTRSMTPRGHVSKAVKISSYGKRKEVGKYYKPEHVTTNVINYTTPSTEHTTGRPRSRYQYMEYMKLPPVLNKDTNEEKKYTISPPVSMVTGDTTLSISGANHTTLREYSRHDNRISSAARQAIKITGQTMAPPSNTPTESPNMMTSSPGHMTSSPGHMTSSPGHMTSSPGHMTSSPGHMTSLPGHMTHDYHKREEVFQDSLTGNTLIDHYSTTPASSRHMTTPLINNQSLHYSSSLSLSQTTPSHMTPSQTTPYNNMLTNEQLPPLKLRPLYLTQKILQQATPQYSQSPAAKKHILKCNPYNISSLKEHMLLTKQEHVIYSKEGPFFDQFMNVPPLAIEEEEREEGEGEYLKEWIDQSRADNEKFVTKNEHLLHKTVQTKSDILFIWTNIRPLLSNNLVTPTFRLPKVVQQ